MNRASWMIFIAISRWQTTQWLRRLPPAEEVGIVLIDQLTRSINQGHNLRDSTPRSLTTHGDRGMRRSQVSLEYLGYLRATTHNTQQSTWAAAATLSSGFALSPRIGQRRPQIIAPSLPMGSLQASSAGFAPEYGSKMAPSNDEYNRPVRYSGSQW